MKPHTILAALLLAIVPPTALSQGFTPRRPFIPSVVATSGGIAGLAYWWHQDDYATNTTHWIDRIQGSILTNSVALRPAFDASYGVRFTGTEFLTNANQIGFSHASVCVIMRWTDNTHTISPILSYRAGSDASTDRQWILGESGWSGTFDSGASWVDSSGASSKTGVSSSTSGYPLSVGCTFTLLSVDGSTFYTNGVQSRSVGIGDFSFNQVGHDFDGWFLIGDIREIRVYSNLLTSFDATNLQYYASTNYFRDVCYNTGPSYPQQVPGLALYWVASDTLSQGTNVVLTNWVDRIQGSIWTNGTSAQRPTNSTDGVGFYGSGIHFTNSGASLTGSSGVVSNTHWIVWRIQTTASLWDRLGLVGVGSGAVSTSECFAPDYIANGRWRTGTAPAPAFVPYLETNIVNEFLVRWRDTVYDAYTNAVNVVTNQGGNFSINNSCTWTNWGSIGLDIFGGATYTVKELAIWTNALDSTTISNLHWYRTNTYGGSP